MSFLIGKAKYNDHATNPFPDVNWLYGDFTWLFLAARHYLVYIWPWEAPWLGARGVRVGLGLDPVTSVPHWQSFDLTLRQSD